jgi:hypothetical protein
MLDLSNLSMLIGGGAGRERARNEAAARAAAELVALARADAADALARLDATPEGLKPEQVEERVERFGANVVAQEMPKPVLLQLLERFVTNPINILLSVLAVITWVSGEEASDKIAAIIMFAMVVMAVFVAHFQEARSSRAVEQLRRMVSNTATARREVIEELPEGSDDDVEPPRVVKKLEVPIDALVPGDIVYLSAGDMVPAELRLLGAKDLFINQSALTGESMPVEKFSGADSEAKTALEARSLCFMGSNVVSGSATAVIAATGANTYFGALAGSLIGQRVQTSCDRGVSRFAWLMLRFMAVMVPVVFLINGLTKHDWFQAFMFAVAVAVGLTPEMLPMIVAINLAKGALAMSRKKVIVKAVERDPELRRDRRPVHGQDRHADAGSRHPRTPHQRAWRRGRARARIRLAQQPSSDGIEEPARRRRARAYRNGHGRTAEGGLHAGRRGAFRFHAPPHVGHRARRSRPPLSDFQGRGRRDGGCLHASGEWRRGRDAVADAARRSEDRRARYERRRLPSPCARHARDRSQAELLARR